MILRRDSCMSSTFSDQKKKEKRLVWKEHIDILINEGLQMENIRLF